MSLLEEAPAEGAHGHLFCSCDKEERRLSGEACMSREVQLNGMVLFIKRGLCTRPLQSCLEGQ